jgi:hypothetical protein
MIFDMIIYGEKCECKLSGCSRLMTEDDLRECSATALTGEIKKIVIKNIKW